MVRIRRGLGKRCQERVVVVGAAPRTSSAPKITPRMMSTKTVSHHSCDCGGRRSHPDAMRSARSTAESIVEESLCTKSAQRAQREHTEEHGVHRGGG